MTALLAFSLTLLAAMLVSELADRTVLSAAVLFLLVGIVAGPAVLGWVPVTASSPALRQLAHYALLSVLFTDGMRLGLRDLSKAWALPGRALLFGMPLTLIGTALAAHYVASVPWGESLLLGAVLSPTDPVFASAIVGRREIPGPLRLLLNVESGVNDGLALPIVVILLGTLGSRADTAVVAILLSIVAGMAIGVGVPLAILVVEGTRPLSVLPRMQSLFVLAVGLVVISFADLVGANVFLAAFAAGVTIAAMRPTLREAFQSSGENIAELLKLAALLAFGALLSPRFLREIGVAGYVFGLIALLAVRPLAITVALLRSRLAWPERMTAAWFGPKGFASIVFGLLMLDSRIEDAGRLFHLAAVVIVGSIVAHSSTDVAIARWFRRRERTAAQERDATTPRPGGR